MQRNRRSAPITPADLAKSRVRLSQGLFDSGAAYWLRSDPTQAGRTSVIRRTSRIADLTPDWDVRTSIHAYGGTAYAVAGSRICFNDRGSGRVWEHRLGGPYRPITPEGDWSYGGFTFLGADQVVAVRQDDSPGLAEPRDALVVLDLGTGNEDGGRIIAEGADFYFSPTVSPDGWIAWMEYDHPAMPWDDTRIMAQSPDQKRHQVAGLAPGVSALHPQWDVDGSLVFLSDQSGYWNFYRWTGGEVVPLHRHDSDFCDPVWVMTQPPYALLSQSDGSTRIACSRWLDGMSQLGFVNPDGSFSTTGLFGCVTVSPAQNSTSVVGLGSVEAPFALFAVDWASGRRSLLEAESRLSLPAESVTTAEQITWSVGEADDTVVGWFYDPGRRQLDRDGRPPLLVMCHGGPTAFAQASFSLVTQFFTSRGIAVLDVNYSGSGAMGRAYRERLNGQWGVADVRDCVAGARHLGRSGLVDPDRMAIMGGSAGGLTALNALAAGDVFSAAVSLYGVTDLEALARDTTKFESHYTEKLIGAYPSQRQLYLERSPITQADRLNGPVLILQGQDDPVVPPAQAISLYETVRAKGLDAELKVYEAESHGFRMASTIEDAYRRILGFLGRTWGVRME